MRGLVQLILRFQNFLLFLVLQVVCFSLIFQFNNYHRTTFVNSTGNIIGSIYSKRQDISEYLSLREINKELAAENARLKNCDTESFLDLQDDLYEINDTLYKRRFEYLSAKVINSSLNAKANFITIDRGEVHGVTSEMGVISGNSLVGIIKDVGKHFSTVVPVINPGFQASVKLKESGEQGILSWAGKSVAQAEINNLPPHAKIHPGDTIVTTGFSAYFPSEVVVGTVETAEIKSGENLYTATINLSTDYYRISYVEVINNLMRKEQLELENQMNE